MENKFREAGKFILIRALMTFVALFLMTFIVFSVLSTVPSLTLGPGAAPTARVDYENPSFTEWLLGDENSGGIINGDYGSSFFLRRPAYTVYMERAVATNELLFLSIAYSLLIGIPLGILMARLRRWRTDLFPRVMFILWVSAPIFWVGLVLLLIYSTGQGQLPLGGRCQTTLAATCPPLGERMEFIALPAATLTIFWASVVALFIRSVLLRSWARGEAAGRGLMRALVATPWLIPVLVAGMLSSLVIVERVFTWPGIGNVALIGVSQRDYPIVTVVAVMLSFWSIMSYLFASIVYAIWSLILGEKPQAYVSVPMPYADAVAEQQIPSRLTVPTSKWHRIMGRVEWVVVGFAVLISLGIMVVGSNPSMVTNADPFEINARAGFEPPSDDYPLGTDDLGRDQQARILAGIGTTVGMGLRAMVVAVVIGIVVGLIGAAFDGVPDRVLNIPINVLLLMINGIPVMIVLIVVQSANQLPDFSTPIGLLAWPLIVPYVRAWGRTARWHWLGMSGDVDKRKRDEIVPSDEHIVTDKEIQVSDESEAMSESISQSQSPERKLVLDGVKVLVFSIAVTFAFGIIAETNLSFVGIGVQPPTVSLGNILSIAQQYFRSGAYLITPPGVYLMGLLFGLVYLAARLHDDFDFVTEPA